MSFAPTAHLLGDSWVLASDKRKTDWLLNGVTIIDFQLTSEMLFFCPLSSHSSPNQTALLDYILLPFPSFFCVMYIFSVFVFPILLFFFLFLRFVCLLLLNFVIRHKLFQYDHFVPLEQMLIENIV